VVILNLKSNQKDLRKRGMLEQSDIDKYMFLSREQLLDYLNSKLPIERSAAIRTLSEKCDCDNEKFVSALLNRLCMEKALYTKIEICSALEKGNKNTAKLITAYLGKIGNNQHKKLPDRVSKKVSYPLPRDIIARSLGKMDTAVLPIMLEVLKSNNTDKISEILDAIGFLVFYHQELATSNNVYCILETLATYLYNEVIVWKITLCLSAFPLKESVDTLNQIKSSDCKQVIIDEVTRSLNLIKIRL